MPLGKVKWFNNAKGYGFIIADKSETGDLFSEDLFAHFSSIQMEGYKTLKAGQSVKFEAQPSGKGYHAVNIVPVESSQTEDSKYNSADDSAETATEVTDTSAEAIVVSA